MHNLRGMGIKPHQQEIASEAGRRHQADRAGARGAVLGRDHDVIPGEFGGGAVPLDNLQLQCQMMHTYSQPLQ